MVRPIQFIGASVAVSTVTALVWLRAPVVPAVIGALGAGLLLYLRQRRVPS